MATINKMFNCVGCGKSTTHYIQSSNTLLHIFLSFLTAGFWLIVWLLFIRASHPQCSVCGRTKTMLRDLFGKKKNN